MSEHPRDAVAPPPQPRACHARARGWLVWQVDGSGRLTGVAERVMGAPPARVGRRFTWDLLRGVRAKGGGAGAAVLLTTHSMEEAEALADYVVIMVRAGLPLLGSAALVLTGLLGSLGHEKHGPLEWKERGLRKLNAVAVGQGQESAARAPQRVALRWLRTPEDLGPRALRVLCRRTARWWPRARPSSSSPSSARDTRSRSSRPRPPTRRHSRRRRRRNRHGWTAAPRRRRRRTTRGCCGWCRATCRRRR